MPKLNQVNALVTGRKAEVTKNVTELHKLAMHAPLFAGLDRTYKPNDEESGEKLPAETQKVQQKVQTILAKVKDQWQELWDLVLTQDSGNQQAKADIVVDGTVLAKDVPVTTLLFLEKQANDLETFIQKLPVPDPVETWTYDANIGLLRSSPNVTVRTKKVPRAFVKYEATEQHPAQVETYHEDIQAGTWHKTLYSGCVTADKKEDMLQKVKKLKDAVKAAREEANMTEVSRKKCGEALLNFVLGG